MLTVQQISKSFGIDTILNNISFSLNPGERIGLVGPNGCGKTTLLRIITGEEKADSGVVRLSPSNLRLGYLPQGFAPDPTDTLGSFLTRVEGDLPALSDRLERLSRSLAENPNQPGLQSDFDEVLEQMALADENRGRGPAVLAALGLGELPGDLPIAALSGGQKTRLSLAGVLLSSPQMLLLDEPTNHLDIQMLEWLEGWLASYPAAALIVSHDRVFLDRVVTGIVEIDPHTHTAHQYAGSYSDYLEQKLAERERQWQAYTDQQEEIARLRKAAAGMRDKARYHAGGKTDPGNTDGFSIGFFANRGKEVVQKAKNIEKRIDKMLTDERVDKPARSWEMKIDFGEVPASGRDVLVMEDLAVGYGENVLLRDLNLTVGYGDRIVLTGENGSGKTTLMRAVTGQIDPLAGQVRLGSGVRFGYMAQEQENLNNEMNAFEIVQRILAQPQTETRAFLSKFLFKGDDVFIPVGKLSYGERARLSLACLVADGCNFLLLDEPINHLDIPARTQFEQALQTYEGTVLAIVHDRYFIEGFAGQLWTVENKNIKVKESF